MSRYTALIRRLVVAVGGLRPLCSIPQFDLWWLELKPTRSARCRVILTAGIHGDEPAGIEAVARFLERPPAWASSFHFTIFPCMNPHGYNHNLRNNYGDLDIN